MGLIKTFFECTLNHGRIQESCSNFWTHVLAQVSTCKQFVQLYINKNKLKPKVLQKNFTFFRK